MAIPKSVTFRGEVLAPTRNSYTSLILPFVALKKFFQALYRLSTGLLWAELIEGRTSDQAFTLIVFLIFCVLSLISYYCRAEIGSVLILCCLLWFVDYQIAKGQFLSRKQILLTELKCCRDWVVWQRQTLEGKSDRTKFQATEVAQISLMRTQVYGGAFQESLGTVWQVYLTLCDRTELLFHETQDTLIAFEKSDQLSRYFAVPLIVLGSEGVGSYAAEPLNLQGMTQRTHSCTTIRCQKTAAQWHIYSQWQLSSAWQLFGEILHKFGFLLFAVIVANLMVQFGGLLHIMIAAWFDPQVVMQVNLFHPMLRWQTLLELLFALTIMLIKGAQLSREEHLYITPDHLTFFLNTRKISQVATPAIASILFLKHPFPSLLILTDSQTIEIRELQHETEFRVMLTQLNEAIVNLHPKIT